MVVMKMVKVAEVVVVVVRVKDRWKGGKKAVKSPGKGGGGRGGGVYEA
jgi:hypothetical protein